MNNHTSRSYPASVLPIGRVNLKNGKNAMFGIVWDCWERNSCACIVLREKKSLFGPIDHSYRVVVTSGGKGSAAQNHPVGMYIHLKHDQSGYYMGEREVLGVTEHNETGHAVIAKLTSKSSVPFATYK